MSENQPIAMALSEPLDEEHGLQITYLLGEVVCELETEHQHLVIGESGAYGRALFLDGVIQSTEADEALYHEALIHPAMVIHGGPRQVLVGGVGEGACLRELLRHESVERIVAVDLDAQVIAACREHLEPWHRGAYDDPRVEVRIEDIQDTLKATPAESWDAIILDVTEPVEDGPAVDLFTVRFFRSVAAALSDDGIVVLQSGEFDPAALGSLRAVRETLSAAFAWVEVIHVFVPSFHSVWSFTLAGKRAFDVAPPQLGARIEALAARAEASALGPLRYYDLIRHHAITSLPRAYAEMLAVPGRVISGDDDERLIAYPANRRVTPAEGS